MKRSELNEIYKSRIEFSSTYDCISIINSEDTAEDYFSRSGCEICNQGAGSVIDCHGLEISDIKNKKFDNVVEFQLCNGCLCSIVNGDDTDLDYHCDDEDTDDIRPKQRN